LPTLEFEPEEFLSNECIRLLMLNLAQHQPFVQQLQRLGQDCPTVTRYALSRIQAIRSRADSLASEREDWSEARAYYDKLSELVSDYGLNPQWAMELVHMAVTKPKALGIAPFEFVEIQPKQYEITWSDRFVTTKNEIRQHVLKQFEEQWADYEGQLRKAGFVRLHKRGRLADHMRWVFKRVCLKKSWNQIATSQYTSKDTVRKTAQPIIDMLGLKSPELKGGRPPGKPLT